MTLKWNEQLSVGNEVIDSDHKRLIAIINSVEECLRTTNRKGLFAEIDHLNEYAQTHFTKEEKIAHLAGYPDVEHLHQSHSMLIKQLDQLKSELESMQGDWPTEIVDHFTQLLRSWLIDHVIKEDLLLKPLLIKCPFYFNPD